MPPLGESELVIVLLILLVILGSTKLPQIHAWLGEAWSGPREARISSLRKRTAWKWSDSVVVIAVIVLGLAAAGLASSAR